MKKIICLLLAFLLIIPLIGCGDRYEKYSDYSFDYFDTATSIIGFEKNEELFKVNVQKIKEKLAVYHKLYDIYTRSPNSVSLYDINNSRKPLNVDGKIIDLLNFSKKMYNLTDGKVNISFGSVLSIWHSFREDGLNDPSKAEIPQMEDLKKALEHTSIDNIIIDGNTVYLSDKEMQLDVGAVAKGYATEQIAKWMEEEGINGYLLNVGGNIRTVGVRPDGEKWQIGLENPDTDDIENPYIEYLELGSNLSLVTSGSYQRFYTVEGKNYHHIIDPDTLMPAVGFKMVSVITDDSGVADALSTALFCMNWEDGNKIVNSLENTYAFWVKDNGEILYSKGFKEFLKKEAD